jgi:hypothetical protein
MNKLFYRPNEAANILQITTRTLANKRALGNGPPFIKLGVLIRVSLAYKQRVISDLPF